jgi:hypothetical protein
VPKKNEIQIVVNQQYIHCKTKAVINNATVILPKKNPDNIKAVNDSFEMIVMAAGDGGRLKKEERERETNKRNTGKEREIYWLTTVKRIEETRVRECDGKMRTE